MVGDVLTRAEAFIWSRARLVERRAFEALFRDGGGDPLVRALRGYQNGDGGFGHALEPDLRTPASQPIFVHYGLSLLASVDTNDHRTVRRACEFLSEVAHESGAIPYALPDARQFARASHWDGEFAFAPTLNATAGVAGSLHALAAVNEWLDRATEWCFATIAERPDYSGHTILNVLEFLRYAPDRERAGALWEHVTARLFEADYVALELPLTGYGLTPLAFASTPDAPTRGLFGDAVIDAHLSYLADQQQDDGGWPISWSPPGPAAVEEWRGRLTLDALRTLRAYGRI